MSDDSIVIVAARRTAIGGFGGHFKEAGLPQLGAAVMTACIADTGLPGDAISEVLMGCVLPAGVGQAPARQAMLAAGLPVEVGATTLNKVCGSGMKAVMTAHDLIRAGSAQVVLAGGMESMSGAPYILPKARFGLRMGHAQLLDHMFFDGLQNPYDGNMMGHFAEETVAHYGFTREQQDDFARRSVERAIHAVESGAFVTEIAPVTVTGRRSEVTVSEDEEPFNCALDKIATLRPAFRRDGTVTAASSSSISDGAAALLIMSAAEASRRGLTPLARIAGHASHAQAPEWFTTAPAGAIRKLLEQTGWAAADVDLYEINEAFACVTMAAMEDLSLAAERVNVNGGACALGHPIGATGARLIVTLIHALRARGLSRGVAALCIGGGEATAIAVEIPAGA
ncbi:MAG: acetyl-CoA C-acyltransferase [Gammaproteobacteria bacterium]|nr:acetyl-CoA C-acyltransferase [Gammaproteobacteria bacterium]TVQ47438.1 MAG: acetyl-CoA C-acyltransferase [Gammaproteobacteria bacterium]